MDGERIRSPGKDDFMGGLIFRGSMVLKSFQLKMESFDMQDGVIAAD